MSEPNRSEVEWAEAHWAFTQAHASARIEGHIPDAAYQADCEAVIAGTMTVEQAVANSAERALQEDQQARIGGKNGA